MVNRKTTVAASAVSPISAAPTAAMVISMLMLKSRLMSRLLIPERARGYNAIPVASRNTLYINVQLAHLDGELLIRLF